MGSQNPQMREMELASNFGDATGDARVAPGAAPPLRTRARSKTALLERLSPCGPVAIYCCPTPRAPRIAPPAPAPSRRHHALTPNPPTATPPTSLR